MHCPGCANTPVDILVTRDAIAAEISLRETFWRRRVAADPDTAEMKDRTDVMHARAAAIRICRGCGVLVRDEEDMSGEYRGDSYTNGVMEQMRPMYVEAFRVRATAYRDLLPRGANVVEIGSYVGGFLQVAGEWGWRALGIDIGSETTRFARSHGGDVVEGELRDASLDDASADGVFLWNCFDQMPDPGATLREIRRVLRPGGILAIRTPNAVLYSLCESMLNSRRAVGGTFDDREAIVQLLGYNNLLGFPYQFGYSAPALNTLVEPLAFRIERAFNSELIPPGVGHIESWALAEEQSVRRLVFDLEATINAFHPRMLLGPWIELVYRG